MLSRDEKFLMRLTVVIEQNLADPEFSIDQLVQKMGSSRTNLWRKVRELTDMTPTEFINIKKLEKARLMILFDVDTIKQISFDVGFRNQSYFTRCFRKQYGVLPSDYREQIE